MTDILLDNNNDISFDNDDIITGESTFQHQQLLLFSDKGDWREHPVIGASLHDFLKDEEPGEILAIIKTAFEQDGMTIRELQLIDDQLKIDAAYDSNS